MRLMSGILAGQGFMSVLTGDESLRNRPMSRVAVPLRMMGAMVDGREGGRKAPLYIRGGGAGSSGGLRPLDPYVLPVASAQVKSCVMLAGMFADGVTTIVENTPTRDHTERMMGLFGAAVTVQDGHVSVSGFPALHATRIDVPGDVSSAAFWFAASAIVTGSRIRVEGVGLNPLRCGFLRALQSMGCRVDVAGVNDKWEPVGDVCVSADGLRAIEVSAPDVPAVVDELPILAVCAAVAEGKTVITGAAELRHKETDRISAIVENLQNMGAKAGELTDGFWVEGGHRLHGAFIRTRGDHRIAMAFAIAGLVADGEVILDDPDCIAVSYPGFLDELKRVAGPQGEEEPRC
jgi:3-phosphoshikimate 1-carboxyvinyltransferase